MNDSKDNVELPAATASPMIVGLGLALAGAGVILGNLFLMVGVVVFVAGLLFWIRELLPGRGHAHEPLLPLAERAVPPPALPGRVEALKPGTVGYRFRLPEHVHPISSGAKGGLVGGLLMPIPAIAYGLLEHGSPWLPINLLAGMVFPGLTDASIESLERFHPMVLAIATVIHFTFSITFGLLYGVILPMLPQVRGGWILFGGVLMPALWTGLCYGMMGIVNPLLQRHVSWPWFILSQFAFGISMSYVVHSSEKVAVKQRPPRTLPAPEDA